MPSLSKSTQVEILLGYLTVQHIQQQKTSTQVEILLGYLTIVIICKVPLSTQVEILLGYLTLYGTMGQHDLHK